MERKILVWGKLKENKEEIHLKQKFLKTFRSILTFDLSCSSKSSESFLWCGSWFSFKLVRPVHWPQQATQFVTLWSILNVFHWFGVFSVKDPKCVYVIVSYLNLFFHVLRVEIFCCVRLELSYILSNRRDLILSHLLNIFLVLTICSQVPNNYFVSSSSIFSSLD